MLIHRTAVIQRRNRACDLAAGRNQQITVRIFLFIEILTIVLQVGPSSDDGRLPPSNSTQTTDGCGVGTDSCCVSDAITHDDRPVFHQRQAGTERSDTAACSLVRSLYIIRTEQQSYRTIYILSTTVMDLIVVFCIVACLYLRLRYCVSVSVPNFRGE